MISILLSMVFSSSQLFFPSAHAYLTNAQMPACLDGPDEMRIDNQRVLDMKHSTKNQYHDRGFVQGIVAVSPNQKNDHDHFVIKIGPNVSDTIEIVYNRVFGSMPNMNEGDPIVVCGDYITSNAKAGGYDASPEGAIIHWVHFNPGSRQSSAHHEHGFIMVGTNLAGFDEAPEGDWSGRIIRTQEPSGTGPDVQDATQKSSQGIPNRGGQGQGSRRPQQSHSAPCRTFDECRARNGG